MIVVVKLTLALLWLIAFVLTCAVLSITFPFIFLNEKMRSVV